MSADSRSVPRARKRFGQHFLHDPAVLERIVAAIGPRPSDRLVEIGPGRGALTRRLLARGVSLDAVEIDRDLVALLRQEFASERHLAIHEADALAFDFEALAVARGGAVRVVGNLPYNISTPLLFHLLAQPSAVLDLHLMLQREVVARLAAQPGEDAYGRLTVMIAPYVAVEELFAVGPGAFQPPPKVWSAVVRLHVRATPAFAVSPLFGAIVAAAFGQRRKTLRNTLRPWLTPEQIAGCGVDPGARPETVAPDAFNALAAAARGP